MANEVEKTLTDELLPLLQSERLVTIATVDHETGAPNVSAISWVHAPDKETVRFAVDNRSRIVENINAKEGVVLSVIGNGSTYSIAGDAKVKVEKLDDVPLKLACVEISIKEVRDVMFYGAKISVEPKYEKTYDPQAAAKLDKQVMEAIKKA
ncbi:pyridoxamine 5'-phosphate oxidase family protein [Desertibacillus haloalkaliphilus]|uniref:pyridoxamine 5'-phosphate oxidase family protein n=1 Tax=Desertibacillus haloalkaliphilus TaxID=1328930 RepID=UPI001C2626A5|nr:pyridoxamine 5'-phosphate oxidase family protein [Desertibacillus haloalkaliphilus]MBU8906730.1 pyridoxamine 5'-phosphate oxidase family protein [Desertibacillus haloalkaliphilus]